jgi:hypothetical protein
MIPRLANRTPRMVAARGKSGQSGLESIAAEFALLAQRRSRAMQQIGILEHQRAAAAAGFAKLQRRIAWLLDQMDELTPELRATAAAFVPPEPQHRPRSRTLKPATPVQADTMAAICRKWVAGQPEVSEQPSRPRPARRTCVEEKTRMNTTNLTHLVESTKLQMAAITGLDR